METTIICDIDGTLISQEKSLSEQYVQNDFPTKAIEGCKEKLLEWAMRNYKIILLTGRRESLREFTISQLKTLQIPYDQLIMDAGTGRRHLINDLKPYTDEPTAIATNLPRNQGIKLLD